MSVYLFSIIKFIVVNIVVIISEERREAEEERKRIQANIEEHKKLEAEQQAEMKRVK